MGQIPSPSPKKSLGQHWLHDQDSLEAMVAAASVQSNDTVLEIGPGQGALTAVLVEHGANIQALEFDSGLISVLQNRFRNLLSDQLKVKQGDIRVFDFNAMPEPYKIVANIPYYLTANLMRRLSEPQTHKPLIAALLMQKEVAVRVAAQPGSMAFISVAVQLYYQATLGREVPAELFTPPPKVDSQILILKRHPKPLFTDIETSDFLRFVKFGFAQRRKTLLNNLISGLHLSRDQVQAICQKAGIDPTRRPQTLSIDEWHVIYLAQHLER
ncbi:MAG: 16S rRNA (adenine(1518)-N(6)/adenine(1519)-N(6))-dimethyltransferase RsmA [Candidatus Saccharimonadales bacterium]